MKSIIIIMLSLFIVGIPVALVMKGEEFLKKRQILNSSQFIIIDEITYAPKELVTKTSIGASLIAYQSVKPQPFYLSEKLLNAVLYKGLPADDFDQKYNKYSVYFEHDGYEVFISDEYNSFVDMVFISSNETNLLCIDENCKWNVYEIE